jgi:hypothetical protein
MKATSEKTVHDAVIVLLRKAKHSPIQAEAKWDSVYSRQYHDAKPGVTHRWIIGAYTFEFVKQAPAIDLVDVIAQASQEAHNLETGSRINAWVATIAVIVILIAAWVVIF